MKKYFAVIAIFALTLAMLTGCRGRVNEDMSNADNNADTCSSMLPAIDDTVDPTNGANQDTGREPISSTPSEDRNDEPQDGMTNDPNGEDAPARGRRRMLPIH